MSTEEEGPAKVVMYEDLIDATVHGDLDSVKRFLIHLGKSVNEVDNIEGNTPLHISSRSPSRVNLDLIELFLKHRPNVNKANKKGETALMLAVECRFEGAVLLLIKAGADVNASDNDGNTALMRTVMITNQYQLDTI
jgi:ankyrin repeat protein